MDPVLPAGRCVVEALEDVTAEAEIVEAIAHLKSLGYRIALDDFVFNDSLRPLLETADFVKLDSRVGR